MFSSKASRSLQKHASQRALNLKCQPRCQRALTTRDAPGIVRLLFTRSYFKMSKGFCMSYEHDRLLRRRASSTGGLKVSEQHPCTPPPNTAKRLVFPPNAKIWGGKPPFSSWQTPCLPTAKARLLRHARNRIPSTKIRELERKSPALDKRARGELASTAPAHNNPCQIDPVFFLMRHPTCTQALREAGRLFSCVKPKQQHCRPEDAS